MGLTKEKATLAIALGQFIKKIDVALDQVFRLVLVCPVTSNGLLICSLISDNQGLEKSRAVSNLRKIS